ncbi:hypothetical protein ABT278_38795 [Streptomyces sp. NPDC001228]|uniref:hypothetical protein n=1 Tax=Streptomyces sp. NPDC001228 TaxID=3154381 RepID=UPI00332358DC
MTQHQPSRRAFTRALALGAAGLGLAATGIRPASAATAGTQDTGGDQLSNLDKMRLTTPGSLQGTLRHADGTWSGLSLSLQPGGLATQGGPRAVAAMPDGRLQFLAYGADGHLYHCIRFPDGSWQRWVRLNDDATDKNFAGGPVAMAVTPDYCAHVMAIDKNGGLQYNLRAPDGSWQGWQPVVVSAADGKTFRALDMAVAALPNNNVKVFAYDASGSLQTTDRWALVGRPPGTGVWDYTGWHPVPGAPRSNTVPSTTSDLAATGMPDGTVQIVTAFMNNPVYHTIMNRDGSTYQDIGWAPVPGDDRGRFNGCDVAITGMSDGSAQLVAVRSDSTVGHVIRNADGSWTAPDYLFAWDIPGDPAHPPFDPGHPEQVQVLNATAVAAAGLPDGSMYTLATMA